MGDFDPKTMEDFMTKTCPFYVSASKDGGKVCLVDKTRNIIMSPWCDMIRLTGRSALLLSGKAEGRDGWYDAMMMRFESNPVNAKYDDMVRYAKPTGLFNAGAAEAGGMPVAIVEDIRCVQRLVGADCGLYLPGKNNTISCGGVSITPVGELMSRYGGDEECRKMIESIPDGADWVTTQVVERKGAWFFIPLDSEYKTILGDYRAFDKAVRLGDAGYLVSCVGLESYTPSRGGHFVITDKRMRPMFDFEGYQLSDDMLGCDRWDRPFMMGISSPYEEPATEKEPVMRNGRWKCNNLIFDIGETITVRDIGYVGVKWDFFPDLKNEWMAGLVDLKGDTYLVRKDGYEPVSDRPISAFTDKCVLFEGGGSAVANPDGSAIVTDGDTAYTSLFDGAGARVVKTTDGRMEVR